MAQASVSRQSIRDALIALETQQFDPVVDSDLAQAVAIAREALLSALSLEQSDQSQPATILIADLTGFTAIAEQMDAEQVQEALNALWLDLDAVVSAWGGRIDQHAGDSIRAVFGLPWQRPHDAWRAVQAAQTMQLALASFNDRARRRSGEANQRSWSDSWPGPLMRIGVHEGSITLGVEQQGTFLTPAGDTLRIAQQLEEAAPPGTILISPAIRDLVHGAFQLEPLQSPTTAFLVGEPKLQESDWQPGTVAGATPRLIGRTEVLEELQDAFQRASDASSLEIITVIGDPGSGKTRVLQEFLPQIQLFSRNVTVFRTRVRQQIASRPYTLLRDLLERYLHLYPAHNAQIIRARIEASSLLAELPEDTHRYHIAAMEQLLLPNDGPAPLVSDMTHLAQALMEKVAQDGALVVVCEDVHFADAYSLSLLDSLLKLTWDVPVLIVGLAQPSLLQRPSATAVSWLGDLSDPFIPAAQIVLPPLSAVESRLLVADLLHSAAPLPQRHIDLAVADANGNPWAIEETVRTMIDLGLVTPGTRRQLDLSPEAMASFPHTLSELIMVRLQQLPLPDRQVMAAAAFVGEAFWDTALFTLLANEMSEPDILAALLRCTSAGWFYSADHLSYGGDQGYYFARSLARQQALTLLTSDQSEIYHERLLLWQRQESTALHRSQWLAEGASTSKSGGADVTRAWR